VSVWETRLKTVILFVILSVGINGTAFTHFSFKLGLRKYFNMVEKKNKKTAHIICKHAETVNKPEAMIYMEHAKVYISNEAERIDC